MAKIPYQVRVLRKVEQWLTIYAGSPEEAEQLAATQPQIVHVFPKSTIRGDRLAPDPPQGLEE